MKWRAYLIAAAILELTATCFYAFARPAANMSAEEAIAKAPVILAAEWITDNYQQVPKGKACLIDQFACWDEFRITHLLRDERESELQIGLLLHLPVKSNNCIYPAWDRVWRTPTGMLMHQFIGSRTSSDHLRPDTDGVLECVDTSQARLYCSYLEQKTGRHPNTTSWILFLIKSNGRFEHYGSFISPTPWSKELEDKITAMAYPPLVSQAK